MFVNGFSKVTKHSLGWPSKSPQLQLEFGTSFDPFNLQHTKQVMKLMSDMQGKKVHNNLRNQRHHS